MDLINQKVDENNEPFQKPRSTVRGKAALLANLEDSDSDSDENGLYMTKNKNSENKSSGIYLSILNQTKKERKDIQKKFDHVEKKLLIEQENNQNMEKKSNKKTNNLIEHLNHSFNNDDDDDNNDSDSLESESDLNSQDSTFNKFKSKKFHRDESPNAPSPPPPPTDFSKSKRASFSKVDKQLKELEKIKKQTALNMFKTQTDDFFAKNSVSLDDELDNEITVRVSTKKGVLKWELNKNESFAKIYEELSIIENAKVENLFLILNEKKIKINDTPKSIELKAYDIIDCIKIAGAVKGSNQFQERIKIIDEEEQFCLPNMIHLTFQTQEGRKSRIKFLIYKDEKFENILKKYLEKRELKDLNEYMIEFDGDKVNLSETPNDLDLEGDEIFDVKKSNKPALEQVKQNKNNYEFDDDILCI